VTGIPALDVLFRWLHVGTAIVLLGGSVFLRFVVLPATDKIEGDSAQALRDQIRSIWKFFVHIGVLFLLGSGLYNYLVVMVPKHRGDSLYHALMGTKILLALAIFFLAEALVGRAAAFEGLRRKARTWLVVIILFGAIIVGISGFLKIRGVP
jgi:uncharacterized membrane protein